MREGFIEAARGAIGGGAVLEGEAAAPYLGDFWGERRGRALCVLRPGSTAATAAVVRLANAHRVGLVPQGGNTGLVGAGIPTDGSAAVVSFERMTKVRDLDPRGHSLVAEAGCVLADLQAAAAKVGRLLPLSLAAEGSCRIGGNLATNAGGLNVLRYGMARAMVLGLEVVLADGRVWEGLRDLRKDNTGYDLKQLFVGSEGTLGLITAARLRLWPRPVETATAWLAVASPAAALDLLGLFERRLGDLVTSFELLPGALVEAVATHLEGVRRPVEAPSPWHVLAEAAWSLEDGLAARVEAVLAEAFEAGLVQDGSVAMSEAQRTAFWRIREEQGEATRRLGAVIRSDVAVPLQALPDLVGRVVAAVRAIDERLIPIPFGHVGDGNLHANVIAPPDTEGHRPRILAAIEDVVLALGGTISAEHGIGRAKRAGLLRQKDPLEIEMMRRLKAMLDPQGILNPGVLFE